MRAAAPRRPAHPGSQPPLRPARPRAVAGAVSGLDRITLQLGVVVAAVIAVCSYAVSATSLYALGLQASHSWWQAAAVPVVADGPAIYGMFRIASRSRRGAHGAGYGWLLVICGTAASIGGNVAHAQPDLVAQAIAAAIPLAVLAMLEGLKGDAGEVARLAAQAAGPEGGGATEQLRQVPHATTVRRPERTANPDNSAAQTVDSQQRALPAGPPGRSQHGWGPAAGGLCPTAARRTALDGPQPGRGRRLWPQQRRQLPATPAPLAGPGRPMSRYSWLLRDAALGYASRGIPVLPLHYPLPNRNDLRPVGGNRHPAAGPAARVGIRAAASPPSTPWARWSPTGARTPPATAPGSWPGGPATPRPHRPGHRPRL
jgi:hypothetical protein